MTQTQNVVQTPATQTEYSQHYTPPVVVASGVPFAAASSVGITLRFALSESEDFKAGTNSSTTDLDGGTAISPFADFAFGPNFLAGIGVNYVPSVKPKGEAESGSQADFLLRLAGVVPVTSGVRVFGRVAPGYSIIFIPQGAITGTTRPVPNPEGFVIQIDAGADIRLTDKIFISAGLGYNKGFQSTTTTVGTVTFDTDLKFSYVQLFAGVGMNI